MLTTPTRTTHWAICAAALFAVAQSPTLSWGQGNLTALRIPQLAPLVKAHQTFLKCSGTALQKTMKADDDQGLKDDLRLGGTAALVALQAEGDPCASKLIASTDKVIDKLAVTDPVAADEASQVNGALAVVSVASISSTALLGLTRQPYTDNDDGTVTDQVTGLQWEQKTDGDGLPDYGNPNDVDNLYTLATGYADLTDGTAYTDFLRKLNGALGDCFAGYCDWRLPTSDELAALRRDGTTCSDGSPCIDGALLPGAASGYWSSTSDQDAGRTVTVDFTTLAQTPPLSKDVPMAVRAVRQASRITLPKCGTSNRCVFVTSKVSTADLGGLAGADATCNALAAKADLPGTYVAWLSDDSASAITRTTSHGPYATAGGAVVATDIADLADGPAGTGIDEDEYGAKVLTREVWTNTWTDGSSLGGSACGNWTDGSNGAPYAWVGVNTFPGSDWTAVYLQFCDRNISLYCIQQ